jgi:NAD(P)-dependent dehydrogenase (short-subunit alcohol dehydrogenase family)
LLLPGEILPRLAAASSRLGGGVRTAVADAADGDAVEAFFASEVLAVDHLVLSFSTGRAVRSGTCGWTTLLQRLPGSQSLACPFCRRRFPRLPADGSVTFIGAGSAAASLPATAGLAAVNGGLDAAVRPLAVGLAPLRVNVVAPGVIQTLWWAAMPEPVREGVFARAAAAPAGRTGAGLARQTTSPPSWRC